MRNENVDLEVLKPANLASVQRCRQESKVSSAPSATAIVSVNSGEDECEMERKKLQHLEVKPIIDLLYPIETVSRLVEVLQYPARLATLRLCVKVLTDLVNSGEGNPIYLHPDHISKIETAYTRFADKVSKHIDSYGSDFVTTFLETCFWEDKDKGNGSKVADLVSCIIPVESRFVFIIFLSLYGVDRSS